MIALSVVPPLFIVVYTYTRKIKKASREVRKRSELISVVQAVFSSIRVVQAFAREDYEEKRFEGTQPGKRRDGASRATRSRPSCLPSWM